jgi:amino acid adenylation domain-containing protein
MTGYNRRRHGIHNLTRAEVIANPSIFVDSIAALGPIFYDEIGRVWVCSGYDECCAILGNHHAFSSARPHTAADLTDRGLSAVAGVVDTLLKQMLFSDPPEHTAVRAALSIEFTPSAVDRRDPMMRAIVDEVMSDLPTRGTVDLVTDFAEKLSARLVAGLLGMEHAGELLTSWADGYERMIGSLSTLPRMTDRHVLPLLQRALQTFRVVAAQRLAAPQEDLISRMAFALRSGATEIATDAALDIVASNCLVLVAGGYQTLTHLVSAGLMLLDRYPDQQRLLRQNPTLIRSAVHEILRFDGSSQYVARRAVADTSIGGIDISAGDTVVLLLAAANLDGRKFTDPRSFNIARKEGKHLGFGMGRHYCLGAPYAERLAEWALTGFLDRYGEYHVGTQPDAVVWGPHSNTRCRAHARVEVRRGAVAADTDRATSSVEHGRLTPHERHLLTAVWTDTAAPLGTQGAWHQLFEQHAESTPGAVAVEDNDTAYTYRDIDRRANALAAELRDLGIEPETVVTISMERSAELIIAVLAVAKAGAAFMLVDPQFPRDRLDEMVQEASARLLLTDNATLPKVQTLSASVPVVVADTDRGSDHKVISGVHAGNTAYVVFTSGTTGRPKAIAINHEALINVHRAQHEVFGVTPADRVLQFLSLNFDGAIFEIVMALLCGATLIVVPASRLIVGPPLVRLLRDMRISIVTLTPSVWSALPDEPLPDLRIAAAAGERLAATVASRWLSPNRRFLNLYGPAETAIWAAWFECDGRDADPPIGRPVVNKQLYVTDNNLQLMPIGQDGELCIGGLGVGRYIGRPEMMLISFRHNPFTVAAGQILYRTGDICRWRHDGVLEYRGRRDRQIKIRGQRIELDEVERVLGNAAEVRTCAVFVQDDKLTALVVPEPVWDEQAVRAYLASRLHSAMIPVHFTLVDELPRTPNNKVSAVSNRPPVAQAAWSDATEIPCKSTTALWTWQVAKLFASCLKIPQHHVKSDSDFFSIGGDSLAVAGLIAGLECDTRLAMDVEALIDSPTPEAIAKLIVTHRGDADD